MIRVFPVNIKSRLTTITISRPYRLRATLESKNSDSDIKSKYEYIDM